MSVIQKLRRQMRVISNPNHRESLGGYRLFFVGDGVRTISFEGWWRTQLDFYTLDLTCFSQQLRIPSTGREFRRESNEIVLHAPSVAYEEYFEAPMRFNGSWIIFQGNDAKNPLATKLRKEGFRRFRDEHEIISGLLATTSKIADHDPALRLAAQAAFLKIIAHLYQAIPIPSENLSIIRPLSGSPPERGNVLREKIMRLLRQNLSRAFTFEQLARQLGVSRSLLSHRFSTEMGESFTPLLTRLRMERAQELLASTDKQIKEIAFEVGFEDHAYFSRRFLSATGLSPKDFRKLVKPQSVRAS